MFTCVSVQRREMFEMKTLSWSAGLVEMVGLEVTTEYITTGTRSGTWRERVVDFGGCNAETAVAK